MASYTHGYAETIVRSYERRTAEDCAAYLLPYLRPGQRLLDVGCGPGTITADLAERVAPGRVTGLDTEPAMVERAAAVAAERRLSTVEVVVGDVLALDFADASFDVVHAHQVLQHVADPVGALREMRRVCRPDGYVAARDADYGAFVWYPDDPGLDAWRDLYRRVARLNGGEPDAGRRLLHWAQQAGFSEVVPSGSVTCHATPEARQAWGLMWAERVVATRIADVAVENGLSTRDELAAMADAWRRWAHAPDGWFLVPHGEIIARP
ncbi:MAG: methyltransferase domain-containing protein [Micromonosporaceae bacterium]|nr:methyltransferase domain-containing protein [Micromonosporaceae bacterium]